MYPLATPGPRSVPTLCDFEYQIYLQWSIIIFLKSNLRNTWKPGIVIVTFFFFLSYTTILGTEHIKTVLHLM